MTIGPGGYAIAWTSFLAVLTFADFIRVMKKAGKK